MTFSPRLDLLIKSGYSALLQAGQKGLEKESLRIDSSGLIARTDHPDSLGSALTHDSITTDYSESLIELITPPFSRSESTLNALAELHRFVYENIGDEMLLATSIPIGIKGDQSIPIARYGSSNIGRMKHIYRRGLSYRYGRTMQAIAGLHYNYSFNVDLWRALSDLEEYPGSVEDYTNDAYFSVVRNVHRYGWILIYLFGCSPAIPRDFFHDRPELAARFDAKYPDTLSLPYATSLRMSDIGYRNDSQNSLEIGFNSLDDYVETLTQAIRQKHDPYSRIGIKVEGEYRQLSDAILQIENEYYSLVRPKQVAHSGEKPTLALKRRGVRYLELRAMDLQCYEADGIGHEASAFLEVFVVWCLMRNSPPISPQHLAETGANHLKVACCGRSPDASLLKNGEEISLKAFAEEILREMEVIAELLDAARPDSPHQNAIRMQSPKIEDPALTPSAQVLETLKKDRISFQDFAMDLTRGHADYWRALPLEDTRRTILIQQALESRERQLEIESRDQLDFDEFLKAYRAQT